ncbi:lysocardiolipin and lysophospholipid acyltransferase [Pancytospora epiphaga]|nr:lysocardiolipin and lysophospholipid acyltransferase [Pancytospora epiphaga]
MNKILRISLKILLLLSFVPVSLIAILVIIISGLIRPISKSLSRKIAALLPLTIWSVFHAIFRLSIKTDIPSVPIGSCLVISNHLGAADFMILNALNRYNFTEAKYVIKHSLRYFLGFYQGCLLVDFLVVRRNFEYDRENILKHIQDFVKRRAPLWLVLYPEGHRVTKETLNKSRDFCVSKGIKPYENVLCPRYKGFELICDGFKESHVKNVLDITIHCTSQPVPSLSRILFSGTVFDFQCDVRTVPINSITNAPEFMDEAFRRKDRLIEEWKNMSGGSA